MINYIKGNVFDSKDQVLVHGCNCFQRMGAGIAKKVKELYPEAYQADVENTSYADRGKLGTITHAAVKHVIHKTPLIVVNAYTQYNYATTSMMLDYGALRTAMYKIATLFGDKSISMPKIGAGLAGGDWKQIETILNDVFKNKIINVYYTDGE